MTVIASQAVAPEYIKVRWLEPYTSGALNRKNFKTVPRGVYNGFVVKPGPGPTELSVVHDDPAGWGLTSGYAYGAFDMASGWSVAVHASVTGFGTTVVIPAGPGQNFVFDVAAQAGTTVYAALHADYKEGYATSAAVKLVQAVDLEADPTLVVLAKVNVPLAFPVTDANIILDDPAYPRVLPFADRYKYGYMSKDHVERLDYLESVSAAPSIVYQFEPSVAGPQVVSLPPGYVYTLNSDDMWVFRNGQLLRRGAGNDYLEVDRGDGYGEEIDVLVNLNTTDLITLRIQKYAAVQSAKLRVLDEEALINDNVLDMNFEGSGVQVLPDGPKKVKVVIGGGGGAAATKSKMNATVSALPAYRAVHLRTDNRVEFCNPLDPTHNFYGVTAQVVPGSGVGDIQVAGIIAGGGIGVAGDLGSDVFVSHDGLGTLTTTVPDATSGSVFRVGILDGAASVSGGVGTDIIFDRGRLT